MHVIQNKLFNCLWLIRSSRLEDLVGFCGTSGLFIIGVGEIMAVIISLWIKW